MSSEKPLDVLVIAASNGENLKLAQRFQASARSLGQQSELLDLTTLDLPLFTPRTQAANGIPTAISPLQGLLTSAPRWVICAPGIQRIDPALPQQCHCLAFGSRR